MAEFFDTLKRLWGSAGGRLGYDTQLRTCVECTDGLRLPGLVPVLRVAFSIPGSRRRFPDTGEELSIGHTRREFLRAAGVGAVGAVLLNTLGCRPADWISTIASRHSGSTHSFRSRPDIKPPAVWVNVPASDGVAPGYVFVAVKGEGQDGPMIMDNHGHLVWFPRDRYATDFKVQTYKGEPVLTLWQGGIVAGHGEGEYVIFDSSYREVRRVRPGNGYKGDLHEFSITPKDTALLTIYNEARTDLSPIGGHRGRPLRYGMAREHDLDTG